MYALRNFRAVITRARLVLAAAQPRKLAPFTICHHPGHEILKPTPFQSMCDDVSSVGKKIESAAHSVLPTNPARQKKRKRRTETFERCSSDDVIWQDVVALLGKDAVGAAVAEESEWDSPFAFRDELELEVVSLSSAGEHAI